MNWKQTKLAKYLFKYSRGIIVSVALCILTVTMPFLVFADVTGGTNYSASTDNIAIWSGGSGAYTGSASTTSSTANCGTSFTQVEGTLTIQYTGSTKGTISFDYNIDLGSGNNVGVFKIDGTSYTASSSFTKEVNNGDKVEIYLQSRANNVTAATATISNLTASVDQSITVTFAPVDGISYTVNGETVSGETSQSFTAENKTPYTISSGTKTNADGTTETVYFSKAVYTSGAVGTIYPDANGTFTPTEAGTITPVFVSDDDGKAPFKYGEKNYWTWDDAFTAANGTGTVILNDDYTLPARTDAYIVPVGTTFLVPFDDANTLYETTPEYVINAYSTPKVYRTLTIVDGATVTVNGAMSVSAKVNASSSKINEGSPTGNVGMIKMQGSSLINVYGTLYCWGYIIGSGSVDVYQGASVYECFQFMDHRGGSQSTSMKNKIFPISQYYVQNIEVQLTLYAGATEHTHTVLYTGSATKTSNITFIGNESSMFTLTEGRVTKRYDGSTDRLIIDVNGDVSLSSITMDLGGTWGAINSGSYVLPLNSNMTININSGKTTINQDLALLPCTQINIDSNATCEIGSEKSVYVYDVDQWEEFVYAEGSYGYSYNKDGTYHNLRLRALTYAPGRTDGIDRETQNMVDAAICVNGTLDATKGYLYTTVGPMRYAEETDHAQNEIYPNHYSTDVSPTDGPKDPNVNTECNTEGNTRSGANIYSTSSTGQVKITPGSNTTTYQIIQDPYHYDTWLGEETDGDYYIAIPVTPAKLLNVYTNDGKLSTYTETSAAAGTYVYNATHGRWDLVVNDASHTVTSATTTPTCTEAGYTTHTCTCGYSYTEDIIAAKIGDTGYTILSEAVGIAELTDVVMLQTDIDGDIPVSRVVTIDKNGCVAEISAEDGFTIAENEDGTITVLIKIMATNIKAGDGMDLYFYVLQSSIEDGNYQAVITRSYADEDTPETVTVDFSDWEPYTQNETDYYRFCYSGIAAKEMTDEVDVVIKTGDTQVSNSCTETIRNYALRTFTPNNAELNTALMDMLNYGAAVQSYFGYNTKNLANAEDADNIIKEYTSYASKAVTPANNLVKDTNLVAVSVSAKNKLMLTFYFSNITPDMTATITYKDHYGNNVSYDVQGSAFYKYGDLYGVDVTGLSIADGRQIVSCEVKNGDTVVASASDSVESYIARNYQNGSVTVLDMLMRFVDSAYKLFH